jgi:uncharacterized protein (TIGR02147 family)
MDFFEHNDYRILVEALIQHSKQKVMRGDLAKAAGCSSSWITRVFAGSVQLTPDQLLGISIFFHLNDLETDFLLGLLEIERAATNALKKRIKAKLDRIKKEAKELRIPVNSAVTLSDADCFKYYSSWWYAAIHVASMIQSFSVSELAERFHLNIETTLNVLRDLEQMGLVQAQSGRWQASVQNFHLSAASHVAKIGHVNWRHRSIEHLQKPYSEGLHYSGPHTLSQADFAHVTEKLKAMLIECRQVIEASPSESVAILCLDWYQLEGKRP